MFVSCIYSAEEDHVVVHRNDVGKPSLLIKISAAILGLDLKFYSKRSINKKNTFADGISFTESNL